MNILEQTLRLGLKLLVARCIVELQIAAEHLIAAIPIEDNLAFRTATDFTAHKIVSNRGTDRCNILRLNGTNNLRNRIPKIVRCQDNLLVFRPNMLRNLASLVQIFGSLKADAERPQIRCTDRLQLTLNQCSNQTAVQATTQKRSDRSLRHHTLLNRSL